MVFLVLVFSTKKNYFIFLSIGCWVKYDSFLIAWCELNKKL
jgi:hypothetical protein